MTTSFGSDYLFGGVWIFKNIYGWKIFLDLKEFTEISGKKSDYLDTFMEVTCPVLSGKFSLGAVGMYDCRWTDDNRDWFFIGPIGYYHFSEKSSFFIRPSYEWDEKTKTWKALGGFKFTF